VVRDERASPSPTTRKRFDSELDDLWRTARQIICRRLAIDSANGTSRARRVPQIEPDGRIGPVRGSCVRVLTIDPIQD
jgi:hypothetical protein